jgi:acyl-CoA thioesterase FadM
LLELQTIVTQIKNTSLVMKQSIYRNSDLIFTADITVVSINAGSMKPVRIPEGLRGGFQKYLKESK